LFYLTVKRQHTSEEEGSERQPLLKKKKNCKVCDMKEKRKLLKNEDEIG